MNEDQELLDGFAREAMKSVPWDMDGNFDTHSSARCWQIAIAMKQARDRICTTAKPAEDQIPPFPPIDGSAIPEKPSVIAAKRLGFEPFPYTERN